uniref:Phosphatase tensin-type domain-containing protein n=1 Tax=Takifugu rubripes TaxID=31033 RepID=A0A674MHK3_TAKRU
MEEPQRTDLTYITERIITVLCPAECPEPLYQQNLQEILVMLQSKHQHNCMVLDTGWLDHLAPNLDQIFSVCSSMEKWLQTHPRRVVVLHCRGGKGQLAVLVASYIDFSSMLNSADLSLDHFAMRRFYSNKLSALMTPSQKRYVWLVRSILKGGLKVSPSPLFLFCVVLHGLPRLRLDGECGLFLRIYQGSQAVCTSAVHPVSAPPDGPAPL